MLLKVDPHYDEFFADVMTELSKYDPSEVKTLAFMGFVGDNLILLDNDCEPEILGMMAARMQMEAQAEYTIQQIIKLQHDDEEESESEE